MRIVSTATTVVLTLTLMTSLSDLRADTVTDVVLGFSLTLPDEFVPRPDLVDATPAIAHAFQFGAPADNEPATLLLIEKLGGVLDRKRLDKQDMPLGFKGEVFVIDWQEIEIDGFEVPDTANGVDTITYNVQIPLKGEAIQVVMYGPASRQVSLKLLLRQVLNELKGEASPDLSPESEPTNNLMTWIWLGVGGLIVAIVAIRVISRRMRNGTA